MAANRTAGSTKDYRERRAVYRIDLGPPERAEVVGSVHSCRVTTGRFFGGCAEKCPSLR